MSLKHRKALITGGAVRVGRVIAKTLSAAGADVAIHYRSSADAAESLAEECRQQGGQAITLCADLINEAACVDLMAAAHAGLGGCDILINNASVFHKDTLPNTTIEKVDAEFWPNCWAPMCLMREFASHLNGQGDVVNMLDRRIETLDTSCVPYLLSKKMLAELTHLAALEYAPAIRVNGIAPGAILPPPGKDDNYLKEDAGHIPLARLSTPEEIASIVLHYLGQASLTGQITYVDGGQHLLGADKV